VIDGDPRQPIEFKPVALGRRRRRFDPTLVGVIVVAIGLAVAVVKPWDLATPTDGLTELPAGPSASAGLSPRPISTDHPAPREVQQPLAWGDIASIVRKRDTWGVRAIVRTPSRTLAGTRTPYEERWAPVTSTGVTGSRAIVQVADRAIVALGITFPDGDTPLDVRIWRRSAGGALYWLDARPVGQAPAQGGLIYAPPTTDPGSLVWGAGEYRIDALTGAGTIQRFDVDIPDRYENVRPSSIDPPVASELVPSSQVDPTGVPVGPFATIDRIGVPLESVGGVPLDEARAWLDSEAGSGRVPADRVSVAYLPRATGLGVRLPDGAKVRAAAITRLAPGPLINGPTPIGGGIIDRRDADPWVVFAARRGDAWAPGIYRIDVTWSDESGLHDAAWHIELRPGPGEG
jgi:hypothetical protein